MDKKSIRIRLCQLISGIFVIFIGILGAASVFMHCDTNIFDYGYAKTIVHHTPYLYVGLTAAGIGVLAFLCVILEHHFASGEREKACKMILFICGAVILAAGIAWIILYDSEPINDQRDVWQEAKKIAGVLDEPFDTGTFSFFQRNRGAALLASLAIRIFGSHLYAFRILNLAACILIYYSICQTAKVVFRNPAITSITAVLLTMFFPLIIYISFIYGTFLSIAFASFGLYAAASFCESGRLRYAVFFILAFPLGILMHQSAAVGFVASVIYLVMSGKGKALQRNALVCLLTLLTLAAATKGINTVYVHITGSDPAAEAVPAFCTVYMGITSNTEEAGPGSQDASFVKIFLDNHRDAKAANRDALHRIFTVAGEYLTGERDLAFFWEKTKFQWLDPTFGARKIINLNNPDMGDPPSSDALIAFYNSPVRSVAFKGLTVFMILVYGGAFITGIKSVRDSRAYPAAVLLQLYVIGGGMLQTIWESLSRYCLGYFLWLIPVAASGVYLLYRFMADSKISQKLKRKAGA